MLTGVAALTPIPNSTEMGVSAHGIEPGKGTCKQAAGFRVILGIYLLPAEKV